MRNLQTIISEMSPEAQIAGKSVLETVEFLEKTLEEFHPGALKDHQSLYELREQMVEESDRGLCLLAVGRLDIVLQQLLNKKLVGSKTFKKTLFESNGVLSTLSGRIKIAYAFGLISKRYYTEIDLFRQIRNKFAHSDQPISFESPEVEKLCAKLLMFPNSPDRKYRSKFISTFLFIISGILTELRMTEPLQEKEERLSDKSIDEAEKISQGIFDLFNKNSQRINTNKGD